MGVKYPSEIAQGVWVKKGEVGGSECMTLLNRSCVTGEFVVHGGWRVGVSAV